MLGLRDIRRRLASVEARLDDRDQKERCARGDHEWLMRDEASKKPFIRCKHCYKQPEGQNVG